MPRLPSLLIVPLLAAVSTMPVHGGTPATGREVLRVGDLQLMSQRHWWWLMAGAAARRLEAAGADDCSVAPAPVTAAVEVSPHRDADSRLRPAASAPAAVPVRNG